MIPCPVCASVPAASLDDPTEGHCICGSFRIHLRASGYSACEGHSNWTFRIQTGHVEFGLFLDGTGMVLRTFVAGDTFYPYVPKRRRASLVREVVSQAIAMRVLES